MITRIPKALFAPVNLAAVLWDASMWMTGNAIDALRFYHDMMSEVLELIHP